jgi:hypothetical protein
MNPLLGNPHIRRIDSNVKTTDRARIIENFAPVANGYPDITGAAQEIDILISITGIQHVWCSVPDVSIVSVPFDVLRIYNMFPERALEELLGLVRSLTAKIEMINQTGFLDASVLGEVVTPRDFNTLKRIADEDDAVIEEQESCLELASSEALLAELQKVLCTDAQRWLTDLDDGIHSGLERRDTRGMFFYFTAPPESGRAHFWRYYDLTTRKIIDNRWCSSSAKPADL